MKDHFICVKGNHFVNLAFVSDFEVASFGERDQNDKMTSEGWAVQVTVGKTTYHLNDAAAWDAAKSFNKATGANLALE